MTYEFKLCEYGGRECFNLFAFSASKTQRVYKYLEQRTLNLTSLLLLIFTERASFPPRSEEEVLDLVDLLRLQSDLFHKPLDKV